MKNIGKNLLNGLKYFVVQTLGEVILIVVLMYCGLPYSEMSVGSEHLYEIIIGILGYHAFFKTLIYGWLYLLIFTITCSIKKGQDELMYSVINAILSLLLPLCILVIRQLSLGEMANVFIATIVTSLSIILSVKLIKRKSQSGVDYNV